MFLLRLAPAWHRAYVRDHPLGLAVSAGVFASGLMNLILPQVTEQSAPSLVLPEYVLLLFNLVWTVGGALACFGLLRGRLRAEVPGLYLLAGGLTSYYVVIFTIRAWSALSAIFILLLAAGCAVRAWHLTRCGYSEGVHR